MNAKNRGKLADRVVAAAEAALSARRYLSPIDILAGIRWVDDGTVKTLAPRAGRISGASRPGEPVADLGSLETVPVAENHVKRRSAANQTPKQTAFGPSICASGELAGEGRPDVGVRIGACISAADVYGVGVVDRIVKTTVGVVVRIAKICNGRRRAVVTTSCPRHRRRCGDCGGKHQRENHADHAGPPRFIWA
jgi:hypothetical protein